MNQKYPFLEIQKPNGDRYTVELKELISEQKAVCIDIGRQDSNHIVLPDPQKTISRHHCSIQYYKGRWWIIDEGSSNGTFISRNIEHSEVDVRSEDMMPIKNGDNILILGEMTPSNQALFWRLKFIDPGETKQVFSFQKAIGLEYSIGQKKLFRNTSRSREEISLQNQELSLIDYMSRLNRNNQNKPVVCEYEAIVEEIWGENHFGIDRKDVTHLVWRLRAKIEDDSGEPQFLKTVRGCGYRLNIEVID